MKTAERKHLKSDELTHSVAMARDLIEPRVKQLLMGAAAIAAVAVVVLIVVVMRNRASSRGEDLLGVAMGTLNERVVPLAADSAGADAPAAAQLGASGTFPTEEAKLRAAVPQLRAAAEAFPDSTAGVTARYHLASSLAHLGQREEAVKEFDAVIAHGGSTLYGEMALLGKADAERQLGRLDAAITSWRAIAASKNPDIPQDAVLMELARAYLLKGNRGEAKKAFTELVERHPSSAYLSEAQLELGSLKG